MRLIILIIAIFAFQDSVSAFECTKETFSTLAFPGNKDLKKIFNLPAGTVGTMKLVEKKDFLGVGKDLKTMKLAKCKGTAFDGQICGDKSIVNDILKSKSGQPYQIYWDSKTLFVDCSTDKGPRLTLWTIMHGKVARKKEVIVVLEEGRVYKVDFETDDF